MRDQRDDTDAIADAAKRQLLGAVVKLRYADRVAFLDVGQVVAGHQIARRWRATRSKVRSGSAPRAPTGWAWATTWTSPAKGTTSTGRRSLGSRPPVPPCPERLLQPLPPGVLAVLGLTGFPPDMVLGLTVGSINGLQNGSTRPGVSIAPHPRWADVIEQFRAMRSIGALSIRTERDSLGRPRFVLVDESKGTERRIKDMRLLLGLEPAVNKFPMVYGLGAGTGREIRMITRPLLDVLLEVACRIEVPMSSRRRPLPTSPPSRSCTSTAAIAVRIILTSRSTTTRLGFGSTIATMPASAPSPS